MPVEALAVYALRCSVLDWNVVPTGSMRPTIVEGDYILVDKRAYDWRLPALIVSHDPADAILGDRIAVLESGRIVQQGTADELRRSPASEFVAGLLDAAPPADGVQP